MTNSAEGREMNLSECSKQELNMMVAKVLFPNSSDMVNGHDHSVRVFHEWVQEFDWVNDRNLWAGLMVDNHIDLARDPETGMWEAEKWYLDTFGDPAWDFESENAEPGRAAVETFIKMKQEGVK